MHVANSRLDFDAPDHDAGTEIFKRIFHCNFTNFVDKKLTNS